MFQTETRVVADGLLVIESLLQSLLRRQFESLRDSLLDSLHESNRFETAAHWEELCYHDKLLADGRLCVCGMFGSWKALSLWKLWLKKGS